MAHSFKVSNCSGCGTSLARAKAEVAGMKGETAADGQGIPMGNCPRCGVANPLVPDGAPADPPPAPDPDPPGPSGAD